MTIEQALIDALQLQTARKFPEAEALYRQILNMAPDNAEAYCQLGNTLRYLRRTEDAIDSFNRAIAMRPDFWQAHNGLGKALKDKKEFDRAVAAQQRAIELNPDSAEAHYDLGIVYAHKEQVENAIAAYQRALELKPDYHEARVNLTIARTAKAKIDKIVRAYQSEIAFVPDLSQPRYSLGNLLNDTRGPNLVMGMAWNLGIAEVRVFVESLRRHYQGDVMLIVTSQESEALVRYLLANGVLPIYFDCPIWMNMHMQVARYVRFAETLRSVGKEYSRVFLTDVSDVLFQADPFSQLPDGELLFFLESASRTIGDCGANSTWIDQIYGGAALQQLRSRQILCSGTTIGSHRAILHYLDLMLEHAKPGLFAKLKKHEVGHDQGIHNFLFYTGALSAARAIPNGQHVYTVGFIPDSEINLGQGATILTPEGKACPIVHQYTYKALMMKHVHSAYPMPQTTSPR